MTWLALQDDMASNEILELILQELKRVQERAEKLNRQAQAEGGNSTATMAVSSHIEKAVRNIRQLIRDFEEIDRDKSA